MIVAHDRYYDKFDIDVRKITTYFYPRMSGNRF